MEKEFLESGGKWQEFLIDDIFNINTPKKKFDANKITFGGEYPYVARGDKNNGIRGYITEDINYLNSGNTISFGQDTATMFYQENAYFTGDKIKVFSLKNGKLNKLNSQFLISAMKKSFGLFSWGSSSFSEENLKQAKIQLPILNNGVAFEYMELYMRELQKERLRELQKERLRELQLYLKATNLSSYELTDDEINIMGGGNIYWDTYRIGDLFDIFTGRDIIIGKTIKGDVPLISHQHANNGISCYIEPLENRRVFDFNNTLPLADRGVFLATTQNQNFHIGTRVKALKFKTGNKSKEERLFFVTAINKLQVLFMEYSANATDRLPDFEIKLPTKNNQIDFDYMATYITAIQKLIIKDLVLYTEKELQAYQEVIG